MTQTNLIDAIKTVQDNFPSFTDNLLQKFFDGAKEEIEKRKSENNFNPRTKQKLDKVAEGSEIPQE